MVICVGAAAVYTKQEHPVYRATMKVVVGQADSFFQPDVADTTEIYTQTMRELVKSGVVRPKPLLNLGGAAALGLVLGILAAVIRVQVLRPAVPQLRQLGRKTD